MYRVYILLLLAIGSLAFAVDSSESILQAKKIGDTSVTISWHPIADAEKYKIFYDETSLLEPTNPRPLFDTDFLDVEQGEITKISPSTEYTIVVHWYNSEWNDIWQTLPLHVKTYWSVPNMNLSKDPLVLDEITIELWFTHAIDASQAEISVMNLKTKKLIPVQDIKNSPDDLRIIIATLKTDMEIDISHELTFKKIVSYTGVELPPENRIPLKIVYSETFPSLETTSPDVVPGPDWFIETSVEEPVFTEPVPIDTLPQTGPRWFFLLILASLVVFFTQKKLSKRA